MSVLVRPLLCASAVAAALVLSGCAGPAVVRVVDGREQAGRFISPAAYAFYARGAEAEARGQLETARAHYLEAADEDAANVEIWTRIFAVDCAIGNKDEAREALGRATENGADYEPLFRERAACTLARAPLSPEDARSALSDSRKALQLDPNSEDAALLHARAAEAAGDTALAEKVLRELVARSPGRSPGWQALADFAERHDNSAAKTRASEMLAHLAGSGPAKLAAPLPEYSETTTPLERVDSALSQGSLDEARKLAKIARIRPADLAIRAAAAGQAQMAKEQADLVFRADPTNSTAAIALAVASDLLGEEGGVVRVLAKASTLTTPPSPLARLLFAELILRRTTEEAARDWLGAPPQSAPTSPKDPLLDTVKDRVRDRLWPSP